MTQDAELVGFLYCDLGGMVRGRFVAVGDLERRVASGVGWVPANQVMTPFDRLVTPNPFGSLGDLRLRPDPDSRVRVPAGDEPPLDFMLCGAYRPDGSPWEACPRAFLQATVAELLAETGAVAHVAFEHEFRLGPVAARGPAFSLRALRALEPLPSRIFEALRAGGLEPELMLPESGPVQFEAPCAPAPAVVAADRAVALREVVRDVARRHGSAASFAPLATPDGKASGVHIHVSLWDDSGAGRFHDPARPLELSEVGAAFAAGVLHHARAVSALSASSAVSALRLAPGRWSAGAVALGGPDREALLRIPSRVRDEDAPGSLRLEYRGADATASPYLALGALLTAGLDGIRCARRSEPLPPAAALPRSLEEALDALERDEVIAAALPPLLLESFLLVKRGELADLGDAGPEERCARYAAVY
ncbi:MAG: glutamine synthetase [Solirubrobacteraceae bacterium]|nr:glutamine synthetase [Solirubrobacteraceae bacterium]